MRAITVGIFCMCVFPFAAFAADSVIAAPEDAAVVLPIADITYPQEFLGKLNDFPHTFEFTVTRAFDFSALVSIPDRVGQKEDIATILVKEEKRGVSEVARTSSKEQSFERSYEAVYATAFKNGGSIHSKLQPGTYRFEVSSPNNDAVYRLVLGGTVHRGYIANLKALFEVNALLGNSPLHVFLSVLIYVPLLILLFLFVVVLYFKKVRASGVS